MKKLLIALVTLLPSLAMAASGHNVHLESANVDLHDKASLERGLGYSNNTVRVVIALNTNVMSVLLTISVYQLMICAANTFLTMQKSAT